jgi:transposase
LWWISYSRRIVVIPDNMSPVVAQADAVNPRLTREWLEYSQARGFATDPARVRHPRDNAYAERFVLTARTEVTDRMLIFGERHLRLILAEYETHYNGRRPHRGRQLHPPRPDHPVADLAQERIKHRPVLGGLIHEYERAA